MGISINTEQQTINAAGAPRLRKGSAEEATPERPEFQNFKDLADKLVQVPKHEIDEKRRKA